MKKSYLNSERNTALLFKPSRAFRLLLMVFIFIGINTSIKAESGIADYTYSTGSGTHYTSNGGNNYKALFTLAANCVTGISVNPTTIAPICVGSTAATLTATITTASGSGDANITYEWFSNTSNSTTGGTLVQSTTATTATTTSSYTPSTATDGTLWYYCTVTNTDATCSGSFTTVPVEVVVTSPPVFVSATVTSPILCNGGTATVTLVATGGTAPISYTFNSQTNTTGIFTGVLAANSLAYSITDGNGCTPITGTINVTQPAALSFTSATVTSPILCNGGTATVTIAATDGTGSKSYTFNSQTNTTGIFTGVLAGTNLGYSITDGNSCTPLTGTISVTQPTALTFTSATVTSPILCNGGTATVTLVATGGTAPISYTFNSQTNTTGIFTGVLAGTNLAYSITDANSCTPLTGTISVTQPTALTFTSATVTSPILCNGGTATVTLVATGGTAPISYTFNSQTNTTGIFTGVLAGTNLGYSITDGNSCTPITGTITITQPAALSLTSASVTSPILCNGGTATVTIAATGGTAPISYTFNSQTNTTGLFTGVLAGTNLAYSITDGNSCTPITGTITITQPAALSLTSASVTSPILCNGGTATVTIAATGGTAPLSYTFNSQTNTTGIFSGVLAGTNLAYSITDGNSCTPITGTITITQPAALSLTSASVTSPILCNGGTATVTIAATGGTAPISYTFNSQTNTTGLFTGVLAGTNLAYSITDGNSCTPITGTITITQPAALSLTSASVTSPILCNGWTATVTIAATGGTAPISYTFNSQTNTTGLFTGVLAGTNLAYSITDGNSCTPITGTITITQPAALSLTSASVTSPILCNGGTATVTIAATGGTAPLSYTFNSQTNTTGIFSGVLAGTNLAYSITDANSCTPLTGTINVAQPTALSFTSAAVTSPILCNGGTATVTIAATGGTAPLSYTFNSQTNTTGIFTGVLAGTNLAYSITDGNSCTPITGTITITQPAALSFTSAAVTSPILCNGTTATVTIAATGGTAPLSYTFNSQTNTTGVFTGVFTGTNLAYSITDASNCTPLTGTINVTQPTSLSFTSAAVTSPILCNGGTATVTIVATGGTGLKSYTFNSQTNTTGVFTGVLAGTNLAYSITDASNCTPLTGTINVAQPTSLSFTSAAVTSPILCNGGTATVTIAATGGTAPLSYTFNSQTNTTGVFTGVLAGTNLAYSITDASNCTPLTGTINVAQPTSLSFISAGVTSPILCNGGTATVTIVATGGTGLKSYTFNSQTNTTGVFTGVLAGTNLAYSITDANNCTPLTGTINVAQPTSLTISSISSNTPICSGSTLNLTSTTLGGTGTIIYAWTGPNSFASGLQNPSIAAATAAASGTYTLTVTDANGCSKTTTTSVTVNDSNPGQIDGDQIICSNGDPTNFTSISSGTGSGTITYRWERAASPFVIWSTIGGATSATYDSPGPMIQTTKFRRVVISTISGFSCETVSNIATVTVQPVATAGQIGTDQTICNGTTPNAIISVIDGTGGGTITYFWEKSTDGGSNWSIISGQTGSGLILSSLTQTTMYRRYTIASSAGVDCNSSATVAVTIIVQSIPTSGSIAANQTVCLNSAPALLTSVVNGTGNAGASISYQWWQSTNGGGLWSLIPSATASSYSPGTLSSTTMYRRVTIATLNGNICSSAPSNEIVVTVQSIVLPGEIENNETICYNGDPIGFTNKTSGSGSGTISYRWESFNGVSWNTIASAITATYDAPGPLTTTTQYRRIAISSLNGVLCESIPSNVITVTVRPSITPSTVTANQTICYNTAPSQLARTVATGGSGSFTYQWQSSTNSSTWANVAGQTGLNYQPPALTSTMYYRVLITDASCGPFYSNVLTITVRPQLMQPTISGDQVVCFGSSADPIDITVLPAGGSGAPYAYQWEVSTDNISWSSVAGAINASYTPNVNNINFDKYYRLKVTDANCGFFYSINSSHITTSLSFSLSLNPSGNPTAPVCPGYSFNYNVTSGNITFSSKYVRFSWSADSNYVTPSTGGPSGTTDDYIFFKIYRLTQNFALKNNTDIQVTTPITVTPIVYNSNGTVYCIMSPIIRNVTINPFKINCPANIGPVSNTSGQCLASVVTPNPTFVAPCAATKITWALTGATTGNSSNTGLNYVGTRNFNVGVTIVTYTATNTYGVTTTCSYTVTVADTQAPSISCPSNISVNNTSGTCGTAVIYTAPVGTDNCSGATTTQIAGLASGATFPVGVTTNTYKVTDAAGNSTNCSFTVTVIDNQPPTISNCPSDYVKNTDSGTCTATFDPAEPTANDNCLSLLSLTWAMTGATVANSPSTGINSIGSTTFNIGETTITYTATDPGGNSVTCVYKVVVTDNEAPSITCPVGVNIGVDSGMCSRTFIPINPIYSDNCTVASLTWSMTGATSGSSATTGINLIPSTSFNKGTTTVTYTVKDGAGLTNTCQFLVTVTDNISPTLTCPATPQTRNIDNSVCTYTTVGTEFDPIGGDNCPGYTIQNNLNFGTTLNGYAFPLGTTTVQWIIQDAAGNTSNCSFTVTVNDDQPPVFTSCPPNPAPLCADSTGKYTKTGTSWNATATDGCSTISSLTYTLSGSTTGSGVNLDGVAFNVGTTTVTWTATDSAGNTSNCIFTVTIIGLPAITTQPLSQLDCEGRKVDFEVIATGTGLTYSWQYKRPLDSGYTTIIASTSNVDDFDKNKIGINNVGSTQFPNGTLFQVIVSNSSGCIVTSSAATLSVNEITDVLPLASAVTQCYGTSYSYTVSTSYPANVVSYQWKSSVTSGVWNNVVNGPHFSGANTATLNIINGTPAESAEYRVYIIFTSSATNCSVDSSSRSRSITFLPLLTASVSISESANTICAGTSVTFTATPTNGGTTPVYQWQLNGGNVGTNSTTYINPALVNGDVVTCIMTSNAAPCLTGSPATSNPITMIVPSLSVNLTSTGTPNVCLRDLGIFSVTETAGVTISNRQWGIRTVSGGPITSITGAINLSLDPNDFIDRINPTTQQLEIPDEFILVCTSTSDCGVSAVSNEIIVKGPPRNPGPISGSQNQCVGSTGQVYSVPPMLGTNTYNWYLPSDWVITSGAGTRQITVTIGGTFSGNIRVHSVNSCGESYGGSYLYVNVAAVSVAGTVTPTNAVTCGVNPQTVLTVSGFVGTIIGWESSPNSSFSPLTVLPSTGHYELYLSSLNTTYTQDTYFRSVALNGNCGLAYSAPVLVRMKQPMTNPTELYIDGTPYSAGVTHCANTSNVLSINPVTNAETYEWIVPSGWTITSGQGTTSINVTTGGTSTSGTVEILAKNGGCNDAHSYFYFYLVPSNAPTVNLTQPTCTLATGAITVTSPAPASGITYTVVGTNPVVAAITNTTGVFTNLAPGNYDVTSNNGFYLDIIGTYPKAITTPTSNCATTTSVTINPLDTNTWNGSVWSDGTPNINQNLVFNAVSGFTSTTDVEGCSCTVTTGAVTFNSGHTLKITNWVHVNGGSLTFENTSSLVQINNVTNIGNITYKRNFTGGELDYTYWSSPVAGQNLLALSPSTKLDKFFSFNPTVNDWVQENPATATMDIGKGYIIRGIPPPPGPPPGFGTNSFIGIPNNGHYEITGIVADRSYLLGNPYPSALDADTFLDDNQNVLDGTLYFWTHNTPIAIGTPDPGSGLYAYSGNDYASYNRTGGVSTAEKALSGIPGINNDNIPSGKIASGQGFFGGSKVSLPSNPKIIYDNTMRVGVGLITGDNTQFFKTKDSKTKTATQLEKHRIWLNLTNIQGAFKQTLVGYVTDATNGYEDRFDGESYDGNDFLDFYSVNQEKNLTIQGRALPFDENDEIPLGYRVVLDGTFTIKIGKTDGMLSNQTVYLEDKLTNSVFNLKEGNYTFTTTAGTFDDRFVLRYTDKTLSTEDLELNDGITVLYSNNYKTLIIRNNVKDATVNSVSLYNIAGQNIANWDVKGREQTSIQIPIKNLPSEIYIVKVKTTNGESSKKIIIK